MSDLAAWVALSATCVAALLTAANLGSRATGWGFVIFTLGAVAWVIVGVTTGQRQLLLSNIFLGLVDLFGVWRWLGHRVRIEDCAAAEEERSESGDGRRRFSLTKLAGLPVVATDGTTLAVAVDVLADRDGGTLRYLIVSRGGLGGVGETLHRLPWHAVEVGQDNLLTSLSDGEVARLPRAGADEDRSDEPALGLRVA